MFWPSISGRTTRRPPSSAWMNNPCNWSRETRQPIPAAPGRPVRIDYEYERNGTANIFMFTEPLAGWRAVPVTDRRTKVDWAQAVRALLDGRYRGVPTVTLVMDNLNTHTLGSLYEAFPPAEAPAPSAAAGDALHPQARQLAQHRGERTQCTHQAMLLAANRNDPGVAGAGRRMGRPTQCGHRTGKLALHDRRRSGKATPCLPTY